MKKYHSEKDPFRDRTIIYDEHGKKVGYSEKAIFGDHVNVYDSKGNKVARQEKSFFGDHINVYDAKGKKTGEQHQALFGNHTNVYDAKGNKVGESQPSFWGSGTDYYSRESAASLPSAAIDPSNSWNFENRSAPPASTTSQHTVLSNEMYSNISEEELAQAVATSHELTVEEAASYAKLCVSLFEKVNIKTDGTIFTKEEYKKKVRYGFLKLKSYETTKTKYVPGETYWLLKRRNENEERVGCSREEKYILVLTKSGKFYDGEIREEYRHNGTYVMLRNDWKECSTYQLHELIPLLDLLLKKHSIKMSSGLYWTQLHPQKNVGTSPSCTEKKADTSPSASTNQQYKYVLTALKSGNQADLVKAIRTLYGCGRDEGKRWAESSQLIIMQTNDKNKVTKAVNIFEGEYGIKVTINDKSKP